MIERLVSLGLPPGLVNRGTVYQSKGRWYTGSLVRFYQKNIQPVGGWVQRSLTGATIAGTPNAAHSWVTNDGASFLAIGTTSGLYVVTSGNVVYDILTVGLTGGTPYTWQLENFGSYLIAVYQLTTYASGNSLNILSWAGDTATRAIQATTGANGPNTVYGVVATPERYLFFLRGSDPNASGFAGRPSGALY